MPFDRGHKGWETRYRKDKEWETRYRKDKESTEGWRKVKEEDGSLTWYYVTVSYYPTRQEWVEKGDPVNQIPPDPNPREKLTEELKARFVPWL